MLSTTEEAAAILQARMSWPDAERCAADLEREGWASLTRLQAAEVLAARLPAARALAAAQDLAVAGLIGPREER